jgi:hypothetical protein
MLCALAFVDEHGRTVRLSDRERDRLMREREDVRRAVVKWSRMDTRREKGTVILLERPAALR